MIVQMVLFDIARNADGEGMPKNFRKGRDKTAISNYMYSQAMETVVVGKDGPDEKDEGRELSTVQNGHTHWPNRVSKHVITRSTTLPYCTSGH